MLDIFKYYLEAGILMYPAIFILLIIFVYLSYRIVRNVCPIPEKTGLEEFDQLLSDAGYAYDAVQDIFYTKMNAWQRKYGYCSLYDEAAAFMGMILDTEAIRFDHGGKRWMIQLWKGQYSLNTGCEIGVYNTKKPDLNIPGFFNGTFYQCVNNSDRLEMGYMLMKNDRVLFRKEGKHWWLASFRPGEFSEPWELIMRIRITFKDAAMCSSFIQSMMKIGYKKHEIETDGITAEFLFHKPRTPQPFTRNEETVWIVQKNNERLCERFQDITEGCEDWPKKISAILEKEPFLYEAVINLGKTRQVFKGYNKLKNYSKYNRNWERLE